MSSSYTNPDVPFPVGQRVEQRDGGPTVGGREISPFGTVTAHTERGFVVTYDESLGLNAGDRRCEYIARDAKYLRAVTGPRPNPAYSVTGSSADEYLCLGAGMTEDDARELARQESTSARWGTVEVKRDATGITVATYRNGEQA